jgi:monoterpene epsilon-lactone hydrolase
MSWQSAFVRWQMRRRYRRPGDQLEGASAEELAVAFNERATASRKMVPNPPRSLKITPAMNGEWARMDGVSATRTIFYCHGGGYVWGSPEDYREFAARLCKPMNADVFLLDYRLAPAHRCPAPLEDSLVAWDAAIAAGMDPARTVIMGDSAGGGLALATLLALKERGVALPGAALLMSPWLDMTGSGNSFETKDHLDPMLSAEGARKIGPMFCGDGMALDDWRASPLFADHAELPPTFIQTGEHEILLSDSERLEKSMQAAGVDVKLSVWRRMYHVWQLGAFFVPEGRRAIEEQVTFVKRAIA